MATRLINVAWGPVNIAAANVVYTYTATISAFVQFQVFISDAAGGGDYVFYLRKQRAGAGVNFVMVPKTTATSAAGETGIGSPTILLYCHAADVVQVYVDGLAGDIACNGFIEIIEDDAWSHTPRTLTQSAATIAAALAGSTITIQRGDTFSASITGLGDLTGYTAIDWTVKRDKEDADTAAIIRIRLAGAGAGLRWLNGLDASLRSANGSITIDNLVLGNITIALAAAETDDLVTDSAGWYDIQLVTAVGVYTKSEGICNISADVTRLIA